MQRIRKHHGFNLVELITTMVIMGSLAIIAFPSFHSLLLKMRTDSSISTIQHAITFARNMAISYGLRVTVCPIKDGQCHTNWQSGFTIFVDTGTTNQIDANDKILKQINSFHSNDIVQYNRKAIRFQPDGLASGTNGTLTYCPESYDSPYSKAVIINQAGRARFSTKKDIACSNN